MKIKGFVTHEINTVKVEANGIFVEVKPWIPYSEMEAMAVEMAERTLLFDEENGFACIGHSENMVKIYLTAKYFTDLDVEGCTPEDVYDVLTRTGLFRKIEETVMENLWRVEDIYRALCNNMIDTYKKENSLARKLEKTFGFLFTGEDMTESFAKSELINEQMIDMLGVFLANKKEQELLHSGKKDNSKVKVGGALLNLAKK